jgi:HK97 family phage portal protein
MIAHNLASVQWLMPNTWTPELQQYWQTLLDRPNPLQSRENFMETLVSTLLLSGNAYVEAVRDDAENVTELYVLRPDRIQIEPGVYGLPKAYIYEVEGKKRRIPVDPETGRSSILHLKLFHPNNDWYGLSPLQAAALAIDQYNAVGHHNLTLLENGGRPTGALIMKQGDHALPLTEEQRENLKEELAAAYGGSQRAGKMMVLEGDMEWKEMGLSPKDLDFLHGKFMSAREIAQAFGVPPMLVGVPGDATFANYKEARFHLWEDTILPLLNRLMADFSGWLLPYAAEGFFYDLEKISALAVRRDGVWERLKYADYLTTDEKRAALGYGPLKK